MKKKTNLFSRFVNSNAIYGHVWTLFLKKIGFNLIFFMFSDRFDMLMLKIIFKNKKYYFDAFINENYFKK
jgi:hypothetical protein